MTDPRRILLGCMLVFLHLFASLRATTIIPFAHLGDMALAADAVVVVRAGETRLEEKGPGVCRRTPFQMVEVIKGDFMVGDPVDLDSWWSRQGDRETTIWGDPVYEAGTTYLLFLSKIDHAPGWQPMMLAYGQFYLRTINGVDFFFPSRESAEIHAFPRPDGIVPETMKVMLAKDLIQHLRQVVTGKIPWQEKLILPEGEVKDVEVDMRSPPGHCVYFNIAGNNTRYTDFPELPFTVFSEDDGDFGFTPNSLAHTYVQNAISTMQAQYQGTNIAYGGTINFAPDSCQYGVLGLNYFNVFDEREALVQYNDPCGLIAEMNGCSGTLAIGGIVYAGGSHSFDNTTWTSIYNSYVVVNNGAACIGGSNYEIMLIHELTHGLGFGHIENNFGIANMNPSCCNTIKQLDIDCLDYTYPPAPLPVELIIFTAEKGVEDIQLSWSTASEINSDYFIVERSADGVQYTGLTQIKGHGTSLTRHDYFWSDQRPGPGQWYYRLKQVDLDGQYCYSPIVTVNLEGESTGSRVYPNPLTGTTITLQRQASCEGEMQVDVISLDQTVQSHQFFHQQKGGNQWEISLPDIQPGIYFLRFRDDHQTEVIRFCVSR